MSQKAYVVPLNDAARDIGISRITLLEWMKHNKILFRNKGKSEKKGRYYFRPFDVARYRKALIVLNGGRIPTNGSKSSGRLKRLKDAVSKIA